MAIQTDDNRSTTGWPSLLLLLVLFGQVVSYVPSLSGTYQFNQFNRDDSGSFLSLAHSLAHGRGYTTSLDRDHYTGHTHFPPGYPLPLALGFLLSDSFLLPQALSAVLAVANSVLFWFLARRYLPMPLVFLSLVLLVCSPVYDQLATVAMSEQMTIFFVLLTLWSFTRFLEDDYRFGGWAWLTAAALAYGLLVRGLLMPLLPALWLFSWFDVERTISTSTRVKRVTAILALALLPMIAWEVRNAWTPAQGFEGMRHADYILRGGRTSGPILTPLQLAVVIANNLKWFVPARLLDSFAGLGWFLFGYSLPTRTISVMVLLLFVLGVAPTLTQLRRYGLPLLTALFTFILLLIYSDGGAPRYWLQFHPLLLILFFAGLRILFTHFLSSSQSRRSVLEFAVGVGVVLAVAVLITDHRRREPEYGSAWQAFVDTCEQAKRILPHGAVLLSHNPMTARLISGLYATPTERDLGALRGTGTAARDVYVLVPSAKAVSELERGDGPHTSDLPGKPVEIRRNDYYTLYLLKPS